MNMELTNSTLHYALMQYIVDKGYAPTLNELASTFARSERSVALQLDELAAQHGVVLHPNSHDVWVIHPFSMGPTNFVVRCDSMKWWGNCAWCSLGIVFAVLKKRDSTISTTTGATEHHIEIQVRNGDISPNNLCVHFPIPMQNVWDNVIYADSTMLVFENPEQVDKWCRDHRIRRGDILPIEKAARLAEAWYANHLNPNWKKWTLHEARNIFQKLDLTGPIWNLPISDVRF